VHFVLSRGAPAMLFSVKTQHSVDFNVGNVWHGFTHNTNCLTALYFFQFSSDLLIQLYVYVADNVAYLS